MILPDTSVWIDHFRSGDMKLVELIGNRRIFGHALITAELCMGSIPNRIATIETLDDLRHVPDVDLADVRAFVETHRLFSRGIGVIDASLLASCLAAGNVSLWTRDRRLNAIADAFGIAYQPLH